MFHPRALGLKAGDDQCVPLCWRCHSELHGFGDEGLWWAKKGIDVEEEIERLKEEGKAFLPS